MLLETNTVAGSGHRRSGPALAACCRRRVRHGHCSARDRPLADREQSSSVELCFPESDNLFAQPEQSPVTFNYPSVKATHSAMPRVEITIPEHIEMQITQLVEQGEFLNREEAIEELISTGMKAYKTSGPDEEEPGGPGYEDDGMMGHDDEYVF